MINAQLSDFDDARLDNLRAVIAVSAGVPGRYVRLSVAGGSVVLKATVTVPEAAEPSGVEAALSVNLGTKQGASDQLGLEVTEDPSCAAMAAQSMVNKSLISTNE